LVVLRLTRIGKKKQAQYRVVVADSKRFVNSKFISIVGWYNPHTKESELKTDEILAWLDKGAQPSNTVAKLLTANGVKLPDWVKVTTKVSKPKKEPVAKPEKVEAPAEEAAEEAAPAEEVAAEEVVTEEASITAEATTDKPEAAVEEAEPAAEVPAEEPVTEEVAEVVAEEEAKSE
jgi:small subunit ribosomal protein S16